MIEKYVYVIYLYNNSKYETEYLDCVVRTEDEAEKVCEKMNNSRHTTQLEVEARYEKLQLLDSYNKEEREAKDDRIKWNNCINGNTE